MTGGGGIDGHNWRGGGGSGGAGAGGGAETGAAALAKGELQQADQVGLGVVSGRGKA